MAVLILIVIVLAIAVVRLQHALEAVRQDLANARLNAPPVAWPTERLEALQRRVVVLEEALRASRQPIPSPVAEPEPAVEARGVEEPPPVAEEPPHVIEGPSLGEPAAEPVVFETPPLSPSVLAAPVDRMEEPSSAPEPRAPERAPATQPQEAWEVVVGTSWLNKIGVVVFVVGLALLLGYSMANVGAVGRVAIGYALSLGMLGTGVVLERRETFRNYAYGLMGGGWAGLYFTTYAMHALPAALVVESDLVGSLSLVLVAAGMIVHSLRYQSQTLTALAYVSAYAPLAFSPLSTFSLIATVPLTTSLLVVASRFAWSGVAMLGLASTYAIFILRTSAIGTMAGTTILLVLWTDWLLFEAADIVARRRAQATTHTAPLFVLNAAGFLGAILLHTQADEGQWLLIGSAAAAYVSSALIRSLLLDRPTDRPDTAVPFTTAHGATAVAAALFAFAIDMRFSGTRETVALLVETELLVAAGITLADRHLRRLGTAAAALTTLHLATVLFVQFAPVGFESVLAASPIALLVAAAWYGNREWLRRRGLATDPIEHAYGWVALVLVLDVIAREVPGPYRGPMTLTWALLLFEAGIHRAAEYRYQSYVALSVATILTGTAFVVDPAVRGRTDEFFRDMWFALPAAVMVSYGFAARAARQTVDTRLPVEFRIAAAAAATIGTTFLTVLEAHIAPVDALPAVWSVTAAAATVFGARRSSAVFRWHGYVLIGVAAIVPLAGLALDLVDSRQEYVSAVMAIACLYIVSFVGRMTASRPASFESFVAGVVAFLGSALQALFVWRVVPTDLVAPVWAASAVVLVTIGVRRDRPWQQWQGYALVLIATLRAAALLTDGRPTSQRVLASAAVIVLAYLVSYLGRALQHAPNDRDFRVRSAGLLSYAASLHLGFLIYEFLPPATLAAAWVTTGLALSAVGVRRSRQGQRWQGYGFFAVSLAWMLMDLAGNQPRDVADTLWIGFSLLAIYTVALGVRPALRMASREGDATPEEQARLGLLVAATIVLSALLMDEVGTRLATLAWALQGAALLVVGFLARERVLRLSGLALLFVCILKLFAYDLRQLEALARILSFVVLGLVLLAVSWVYTKYREQIRKLL